MLERFGGASLAELLDAVTARRRTRDA